MTFRRLLGACAGLSIASVVALMVLAPEASERFAVSSWAQAATGLGAAMACGAAAVHTRGRARQVWALFASGLLIWAVTDVTLAWLQTVGHEVPEVSPLDIGWLSFYAPAGLATVLLYLRLRPERGAQGPIDGLIITVAVASLAWVTVLQDAAPSAEGGLYGTLLVALYPTLDLLCLTTLGWIVLRHKRRAPVWLYWVVAAFCLQSTASVAYLISILPGWDLDVMATAAFMGAAWCWTTAGLLRVRAPQRAWAAGTHDRPPVWSESVPFLSGIGVVGLAALRPDSELRAAAVTVAGLMAIRAMAALRVGRGLLTERDRLLVTDPLTNAYNRRFLAEEIERALSRAYRGAEPLSVIALDLDRFKQVNDRLGHDVGDRLLRETSATISSGLRTSDVFCRLGGDEFLILCAATDAPGAMIVAERARARVIEVAERVAPEMGVSASLGVATFPQDAGDAETLLRNADAALYASKDRGRNVVSRYAPLADEIAPLTA
jgi:diguanylate cyclase (GGDEF)-like protein